MDVPRRLYLYAVAFISLEGLVWGLIGLGTALIRASSSVGGDRSSLAGPLAMILVSFPIFLLHGWLIQRGVRRHPGERSTRIRAVFLYGSLLATLLPVAQHLLALLKLWLLAFFNLDPSQAATVGIPQVDRLIAIAINALAAGIILFVLYQDWRKPIQVEAFPETRRLYRYFWLVYGLVIAVLGAQSGLFHLVSILEGQTSRDGGALVDSLARLIFGLAVWIFVASLIQRSLVAESEKESPIRLATLFSLAVVGAGATLLFGGMILNALLRASFTLDFELPRLLVDLKQPVSIAFPMALIWWLYARVLHSAIAALPDEAQRNGLRRLYLYTLAFFGLSGALIGLALLITIITGSVEPVMIVIDLVTGKAAPTDVTLQETLATGLAALLVGLPVWLLYWLPANKEARRAGDEGDQARRSQARRAYLYLVLFLGIGGSMVILAALLYQVLSAILGEPPEGFRQETARLGGMLLLFLLTLVYHWRALLNDRRTLERSLARRHTQYPVLVLAPEEEAFSQSIVAALERQAPELPVAVHPVQNGAPDETLSVARAVILPAGLVARPPEALRIWLQSFPGPRLVVPTPTKDWLWIFGAGRSLDSLADRTAKFVRRLAESDPAELKKLLSSPGG